MSATQARARHAGLRILQRSPDDESTVQDRLLETAAELSVDFENTAPGLVSIDLSTSPVNGHPDRQQHLGDELVSHFANQHLDARIGFAANPDLAALAARTARPVQILSADADTLRQQLAPLPLSVIAPPAGLAATLHLWGIHTLGELTALPRHDLGERLGPEAGELWDRAAGKCRRLLQLVRPPVDFSHDIDLDQDHEITSLEPLLFLLRRSLETLSARLAARWLVTSELTLTLYFSPPAKADLGFGGNAQPAIPFQRVFRIPDPSREVELLFGMLHTRLENFRVDRPIIGCRLEAVPCRPGGQPFHLFETSLRDPNRFADTLARLEALLGSENVGSPVPANNHRPDSFAMRPFRADLSPPDRTPSTIAAATTHANKNAAADASPRLLRQPAQDSQSLPLRRHRPPIPLHLSTARDAVSGIIVPDEILTGQLRGRLRHRAGPWKFSGDWWDQQRWTRQEWDIQLEDGSLHRIAHRGDAWFLEGVYG
jgi:protein ImuB